MRNQHPGICYRCKKRVEAGDGHFERNHMPGPKWRLQHASCAIKHRGTDHGKEGATAQRKAHQRTVMEQRAKGTGKKAQRARRWLRDELMS